MAIESWRGSEEEVELMRRCKRAIRRVVPDAEVILYGSRARGKAEEYSDWDILILVDRPANMALQERMISEVYPLELETGAMLTLITYSREQWDSALYRAMPLHKNIEREGILL